MKAFALIFAALLIAYFPAIHAYYLHTDDYFVSGYSGFSNAAVIKSQVVVGRPLTGLIFCAYALAHSMAAMNVIRALSILNLSLAGLLVYGYLRKHLPDAAALAVSIAMLTTPPFMTAAGYMATATFALAATVSAAAFRWGRLLPAIAVVLLIAALSLYQPGALFYIALVAVSVFFGDQRKLPRHAAIVATACAIYYAGWRILMNIANASLPAKYDGRRFVGDVFERLKWFARAPLVEAANLWFVRPKLWIAIAVGAVILIALWREWRSALLIAAMLPGAYGISLASYMPSTEYRTYAALEGMIALLFLLAIWRLLSRWPRVAAGALVLVAACGIVAAHVSIRRYFTVPDAREFRFVKDEIARQAPAGFDQIDIIVRPIPVAVAQRNELGEPSLRHGPNLRPLAVAAMRELGITRDVPVYQSLPNDPNTWIVWSRELNWITLDYSYGPPKPGKTIFIDANRIPQLR